MSLDTFPTFLFLGVSVSDTSLGLACARQAFFTRPGFYFVHGRDMMRFALGARACAVALAFLPLLSWYYAVTDMIVAQRGERTTHAVVKELGSPKKKGNESSS